MDSRILSSSARSVGAIAPPRIHPTTSIMIRQAIGKKMNIDNNTDSNEDVMMSRGKSVPVARTMTQMSHGPVLREGVFSESDVG